MGATEADKTATDTSTTSGEGTNVTGDSPAFTDRAGNTVAAAAATSPGFKIDKTAPSVAYTSAAPGANANGWRKVDVVATFTATDPRSEERRVGKERRALGTAWKRGEGAEGWGDGAGLTDRGW